MSTNAKAYYENNAAAMKPVRASMPELIKGFGALHQAAMKPGALTVLEKELIALAIALAVRCENCIYAHVQAAVNAGATREQILEAAGVAVLMQGGPSYTYLPRVIEALDAVGADRRIEPNGDSHEPEYDARRGMSSPDRVRAGAGHS